MHPIRRIFYMSVINTVAFIVGTQVAHHWFNPMADYKDFIQRAEEKYQADQKEMKDLEVYLVKKRKQNKERLAN